MAGDPELPIPISYVGSKYLIFDINAVTWLRKEYHICGVMGGTLPQSPSQNLFLGLPVQIMPEEAQLLVEKGVAYIYDEIAAHEQALENGNESRQAAYLAQVRKKGEQVSIARDEEKQAIKKLKQPKSKSKSKSKSEQAAPPDSSNNVQEQSTAPQHPENDADTSLFDSSATIKPEEPSTTASIIPHGIVPTTSDLWLQAPPATPPPKSESMALLPNVPQSYHLYKHLNSRAFFMTPGLRFGCQYCVYPGDPLRFHSHFLAVAKAWDEEINLMDIVGGGRLGTGVKKGFLIGGLEPPKERGKGDQEQEGKVRTFSVEWAAM